MGAKIFVDFTKYSFEHAIIKLKKELDQILNEEKANSINSTKLDSSRERTFISDLKTVDKSSELALTETQIIIPSNNKIDSWNNEKVKEWLNQIAVDRLILHELTDFDGEMLEELNYIRKTASEYFYRAISKNSQVKLIQVTRFSKHLRKLFD